MSYLGDRIGEHWRIVGFAVDRHQTHPFGALLGHRGLGRLWLLCLAVELLDKTAKRDAASELVAARQITDPLYVGQDLIAGGAQSEAGVGSGELQNLLHRLNHRARVATAVECGEELQDF